MSYQKEIEEIEEIEEIDMKKILKKGTATLLTGTILMSTLSTTAFAAEPESELSERRPVSSSTLQKEVNVVEINEGYDEQDVQRLADMLEYLCENAFSYDKDGQIIAINFDVIREKYGDSDYLQKMEAVMNSSNSERGFVDCMKNALLDITGVAIVGSILTGTVEKYITKKAWTELAKFLLKKIPALAGKYVGVAPLVASLVYYAGKYSLQGTTQGRYLTGGVPPVRFSM